MANILLLGTPRQIEQFSRRTGADHQIYVPSSGLQGLSALDNITILDISDHTQTANVDAVFELSAGTSSEKEANLDIIRSLATPGTPVFVNALTMTATASAAYLGTNAPVIGISYTAGTFADSTLLEVAPALQNSDDATNRALDLLRTLVSLDIEVVVDRVGLVSMRILSMIINEAAFALMEGVADAGDIDTAMQLGTNYPRGPLAWADAIGVEEVLAVLQALYQEYQEERYRPCVLLKQYARAGKMVGS